MQLHIVSTAVAETGPEGDKSGLIMSHADLSARIAAPLRLRLKLQNKRTAKPQSSMRLQDANALQLDPFATVAGQARHRQEAAGPHWLACFQGNHGPALLELSGNSFGRFVIRCRVGHDRSAPACEHHIEQKLDVASLCQPRLKTIRQFHIAVPTNAEAGIRAGRQPDGDSRPRPTPFGVLRTILIAAGPTITHKPPISLSRLA